MPVADQHSSNAVLPDVNVSRLEGLPDDILSNILGRLSLSDLLGLGEVNRTLHGHTETLGIPLYLVNHPQHHITLPTPSSWPSLTLLKHNHRILTSLTHRRWQALQIGNTWQRPVIPILHLEPDNLLIGVGGKLLVHPLADHLTTSTSGSYHGKPVAKSHEYTIAKKTTGSEADIIGITPLGNEEYGIAQYDGTLQRVTLPLRGSGGQVVSKAHYSHPKGMKVHTLSGSDDGEFMMTTSNTGMVSVFKTRSPWVQPWRFDMKAPRAWSSMVVTEHKSLTPSLWIGVTGGIDIYDLLPTGPVTTPGRRLTGPDLPSRSSPYDMTLPPASTVHHPSTLLSAWYDSHLRLHDLRQSSSSPTLELLDPWTWADGSAMYSCTYLSEHHVAGGGARHGVVSIFDTRQPKKGWSVFSPGGKGSPVYSLKGEGGRLWGVTERRAFVVALDGSGDVEEGLVMHEARAKGEGKKGRERPSGWKGRGGKWGWTVRYDEDEKESTMGYDHGQRSVSLFESLPVV